MKKASILKVLAFGLVLVMTLTLCVGCGGGDDTSTPASSTPVDDDVFGDEGDYVFDPNGLTSSGSDRPQQSGPSGNSSGNHSYESYESSHVSMTDNTEIFKNIPKELKGKTVKFADWGEAQADRYQQLIDVFEAETKIKVDTILYEESNFITNVAQQINAGKSPDVAGNNNWFPQALSIVDPLPSYFNVYDGFWDERVSEATAVNGKMYFVNTRNSPFTGGYVVYYNKKIFNNLGLKTPDQYIKEGKWTYETMNDIMNLIGPDNPSVDRAAILEPMTIYGQSGKSMINYDPKTGTFSGTSKDPELTASVKYMATAAEKKLTGGVGATQFASGRVGMCQIGTYGTKYNGYFKDMSPADIGVVPCPTSYEGKTLTHMPLGYRGYGICKGAKNGEAAYYFLRYFLDLDKYEKAGVDIFANKVLEKYFRETQLVLFQNSPLTFEMFNGPFALTGTPWGGNDWSPVRNGAPGAVATELAARDNLVQNAVNKANQVLKESVAS